MKKILTAVSVLLGLAGFLYLKTVVSAEHRTFDLEGKTMKIVLDGKAFNVMLDNNGTTEDILKHLPLTLDMVQYAGHEYYASLPFTPFFDRERTSHILAGHIYYWDGWNAFVINYIDYDIAPYKVVHIGEIADKSVIDVLRQAENVSVKVTE
ncbi:MAG: hypothetical protein IJ752_01910 [Alphaproteobacteria bacterium]|nr:hypothetical protein [Alphaproteobacteria bacterium]